MASLRGRVLMAASCTSRPRKRCDVIWATIYPLLLQMDQSPNITGD